MVSSSDPSIVFVEVSFPVLHTPHTPHRAIMGLILFTSKFEILDFTNVLRLYKRAATPASSLVVSLSLERTRKKK